MLFSLGYLGDQNSTQLCGNYNKHYKDPYETTMYNGK